MTTNERLAEERLAAEPMPLHLPDLYIEGFRGIDELTIPRLGRVTLLAGKNGIGKTTVLEAVWTFATTGEPSLLAQMLLGHDERSGEVISENAPIPEWKSLFYGRKPSTIKIGKLDAPLIIANHDMSTEKIMEVMRTTRFNMVTGFPSVIPSALRITHGPIAYIAPLVPYRGDYSLVYPVKWHDREESERCLAMRDQDRGASFLIPSGANPGSETYALWFQILEKGEEGRVHAAMKIVDDEIADIQVTGNTQPNGLRAMAKLKSGDGRVPLRSRGEGAVRMFQIATALVNCKDGFLLIDEASNLLHYTVQRDFWRMVLQTAEANNVQVVATTHSLDCIRGFAEAANENKDVEGVLYRLSRKGGPLRAVEYDERELAIFAERMAEQHLELR